MTIHDWTTITSDAIKEAWNRIIDVLPALIGALVVIIVGLIIAAIVRWAIIRILEAAQVQKFFDQIRFTETMKKAGLPVKISTVCAEFVRWLIIIVFVVSAAEILALDQVKSIFDNILSFVPTAASAIIVLFLGIVIANFIAQIIRAVAAGMGTETAGTLATAGRYVLYIFVVLIALAQLQINAGIINIFFTGLIAAFAISAGLAFGLGGQGAASDLIRRIREEFRK